MLKLLCVKYGKAGRRKVCYGRKRDALRASEEFTREFGKAYRAYQCPACKMWHLTTRGMTT